ncbi:MAG: ATP-binding protein [Candidatus Riflebacteria bacterium]|nr:ATP-binding protein [Candidatus Riflebacteria bacterium]
MNKEIEYMLKHLPEDATYIKLRLNGNSDTLALVRKIIDASVNHLSLKASLLNDLKLATTEACTNIIRHAYKFDSLKYYDVEIKICDELLLIELLYCDPGFDPDKIPVPDLNKMNEGGLGVYIIKNIMDYVKYTTNPENGNVSLKMVKLLNSLPKDREA